MSTFTERLDNLRKLKNTKIKKLSEDNTALSGKVDCTVKAINEALGNSNDQGDPDELEFGRSSYGYGYDSGYGRQRKAMVGYRTPKQRHRRRQY